MLAEIENIARNRGATPDMIRQWRSRKCVPYNWRLIILTDAAKQGVDIDVKHFGPLKFRKRKNHKPLNGKRRAA